MITLKAFKEIYNLLGNLKKENDDVFIKLIFAADEVGERYSSTISSSKVSSVMNAKDLSYNADFRFYMDYFIKKKNRDYIYELMENGLEKSDVDQVTNIIMEKIADCDDSFSKIVCTILKKSVELQTIALIMEWILIASLMQENINWLETQYMADLSEYIDLENIVPTQRYNVKEFLLQQRIISSTSRKRLCAEVPMSCYYELRKILIDNANGTLYIAGETLSDAFSMIDEEKSVIKSIVNAVKDDRIKEINLYLMDPSVFKDSEINEPPEIVQLTVKNVINQLSRSLKNKQAHLNIIFLPYLDIDHAVITDNFMLYRSTKMWTNKKNYKGSIIVFSNDKQFEENNLGEYQVHKKYLDTLKKYAVHLNASMEYSLDDSLPLDKRIHREIRNRVYK